MKKKKPSKVGEATTPYVAKKATGSPTPTAGAPAKEIRYVDVETARKLTGEILDKHHELFRKLAQ